MNKKFGALLKYQSLFKKILQRNNPIFFYFQSKGSGHKDSEKSVLYNISTGNLLIFCATVAKPLLNKVQTKL